MGVGLYKSIVWLWFWIWFWEINLLYSLVLRAREAFDRAKSNATFFIEGVRVRKMHFAPAGLSETHFGAISERT